MPDDVYEGYSISNIQDEYVILAGGEVKNDAFHHHGQLRTSYKGVLNKNEDDVNWKKLPSMKKARSDHAAFTFDRKLFIVGGMNGSDFWLKY